MHLCTHFRSRNTYWDFQVHLFPCIFQGCNQSKVPFYLLKHLGHLDIPISSHFPNTHLPGKPSKVILSPGTAPDGGAKISTFSGELAHITIACDTTPLIFAGFKLQSSIAIRFCILKEENRRSWVFKFQVLLESLFHCNQRALQWRDYNMYERSIQNKTTILIPSHK